MKILIIGAIFILAACTKKPPEPLPPVIQEKAEEVYRDVQDLNEVIFQFSDTFDPLYFDFDSDETAGNSEIAYHLIQTGKRVTLIGHACPIGEDGYNMDLSQRRANAVKRYLVKSGVNPFLISTEAKGESSPVALSKEKSHLNRRVQIVIGGLE